jgi:hypothetical protein
MGKKSRAKASTTATAGEVGPRQPCPCGSGKRYKACHGSASGDVPYVVRTFEGLPGECDWVALREFVPAGIASVTLKPDAFDGAAANRTVKVASVLPGIVPAMVRDDGEIWIAAQVAHQSSDPSRDFAEALRLSMDAEPGQSVVMPGLSAAGPRLQDVVEPDSDFPVTVQDGYDFWFEDASDDDGTVAATLEQLNSTIHPTVRLTAVEAGYWVSVGTKEHLRWVMPHDEERLLTALARLHADGADTLGADTRLVGSFRAHGLLVPVWDLPVGMGAESLEEPSTEFAARLNEALADASPLTDQQRSARHGLANRQLTIR